MGGCRGHEVAKFSAQREKMFGPAARFALRSVELRLGAGLRNAAEELFLLFVDSSTARSSEAHVSAEDL